MQDHIGMDDPGLSLVQGGVGSSIHINANIEGQQEAEDQEEIQERQHEVNQLKYFINC